MSEGTSEALLTMLTIIVFMILLGFAISAIFVIGGSGDNPGMIDSIMQIFAGRFMRLGG